MKENFVRMCKESVCDALFSLYLCLRGDAVFEYFPPTLEKWNGCVRKWVLWDVVCYWFICKYRKGKCDTRDVTVFLWGERFHHHHPEPSSQARCVITPRYDKFGRRKHLSHQSNIIPHPKLYPRAFSPTTKYNAFGTLHQYRAHVIFSLNRIKEHRRRDAIGIRIGIVPNHTNCVWILDHITEDGSTQYPSLCVAKTAPEERRLRVESRRVLRLLMVSGIPRVSKYRRRFVCIHHGLTTNVVVDVVAGVGEEVWVVRRVVRNRRVVPKTLTIRTSVTILSVRIYSQIASPQIVCVCVIYRRTIWVRSIYINI